MTDGVSDGIKSTEKRRSDEQQQKKTKGKITTSIKILKRKTIKKKKTDERVAHRCARRTKCTSESFKRISGNYNRNQFSTIYFFRSVADMKKKKNATKGHSTADRCSSPSSLLSTIMFFYASPLHVTTSVCFHFSVNRNIEYFRKDDRMNLWTMTHWICRETKQSGKKSRQRISFNFS